MAEMASRILSLEKSLAKATDEQRNGRSGTGSRVSETTNVVTTSSAQPAKEPQSINLSERSREDVLVQNGSSSQYFNEILLSRIIEEVSFFGVRNKATAVWVSDGCCRNVTSSLF